MNTAALAVFVCVVALNVTGLALDLVLHLWGLTTITERVWACPLLGVPIVAVQLVAAVALAGHFWERG